jgi:hypothetical protein
MCRHMVCSLCLGSSYARKHSYVQLGVGASSQQCIAARRIALADSCQTFLHCPSPHTCHAVLRLRAGDLFDGSLLLQDVGAELWEVERKAGPKLTVMWGTDVDDFDPETQVGALGHDAQGCGRSGSVGCGSLGHGWSVKRGAKHVCYGLWQFFSASSTSTRGCSGAGSTVKLQSKLACLNLLLLHQRHVYL